MNELVGSIMNCLVSALPLLQCAPSRAGFRRRLEQATGALVTCFLCASTLSVANHPPPHLRRIYLYIYIFFFLVRKTSGIYIFWPKLSQTYTESVVRGNFFEKQGFICYRPVNMIQQN